jgi:putative phage-type endonuclease
MSEVIQGTPEWHALRCGKVTASRVDAVVAKGRNGAPSATRATYMGELIAERLSGYQGEGFSSKAMEFGKQTEEEARSAYSFYSGNDLVQVAFVDHPTIKMAGASPDALSGADGLLEAKCSNTSTHIKMLMGGPIDGGYRLQMQWQMACTGKQWCDFISFDPRLPEHMRLVVRRVERCGTTIVELEAEVRKFLTELNETIDELHAKYPPPQSEAA